jgi:DNA-3-methyladenine glycosylase I
MMSPMMSGALSGPDGLLRCPWALSVPEYLAYHDDEWGRPVSTVQGLYERMTLEAFQSGLSWITILRKRENFRQAFAGFWPERVAAFTDDDIQRLLSDPGIVRNRAKIAAAIENARLVVDLGARFTEIVLSYRVTGRPRPVGGELRATSPESIEMARQLKGLGFRFVGPTTAYATMQAIGLVDDHIVDCFAPPPGWPEANATAQTRPKPEPDSGYDQVVRNN